MKRALFTLFLVASFVLPCSSAVKISNNGLELVNPNKLGYLIEGLGKDSMNVGLSKEQIETRVKLKLRQYNIKPIDESNAENEAALPAEYLYVNINAVGTSMIAYQVEIDFERPVKFNLYNKVYTAYGARTYHKGLTGIAKADQAVGIIMNTLDGLLDQFISDYIDSNSSRMAK